MAAPHKPVHPASREQIFAGQAGITLREHYAGLALQGMLANAAHTLKDKHDLRPMAIISVSLADDLIQALREVPAE
jgi:hypothetical protein